MQLCEVIALFQLSFHANDFKKPCTIQCMGGGCPKHWHKSGGKMCTNFVQLFTGEVNIHEQDKSITTGSLYKYSDLHTYIYFQFSAYEGVDPYNESINKT